MPTTRDTLVLALGGALLVGGYFLLSRQPSAPPCPACPHAHIAGCPDCPCTAGPAPPCAALGDVDGDGCVTAADALLLSRHLAGLQPLTTPQLLRADVNRDGAITAADLTEVLRYIAGVPDAISGCGRPICPNPSPCLVAGYTLVCSAPASGQGCICVPCP